MPAPMNGQRPSSAVLEEKVHPTVINVITPDRQPPGKPLLLLQMLAGELSPPQSPVAIYMVAKVAELEADMAITLGEHLIREGRRAKSGLEIARALEITRP